ncbi:MAG: MMPL family transporter [Pseudomonadota bacterium]
MSKKIGEFILERRVWILGLMLLITLFFIYEIVTKFTSYTNFADLLPQKHPFVKTHNDFRKTFGGANKIALAVTVKEGDIYNYETLSKIIAINEDMIFFPGVDRYKIYSIGDQKVKNVITDAWGIKAPSLMWPVAPKTPEGIKALKEAIFSNDLYYGGFVSLDAKSALMVADFFEEKLDYLKAFEALEELRNKYEDSKHIISIVGPPMILGFVESALHQTFAIFTVSFVAIIIMLWTLFRSIRGVVLPLVAAVASAIWGLGIFAVLRLNLEPLMLVLPVLVSAMGVSHMTQVLQRYEEEYEVLRDVRESCIRTFDVLFVPNLASLLSEAFGIVLIAICPIPIFLKFGLICGLWALQTLLFTLVLGPPILSFLPPPKIKSDMAHRSLLDRLFSSAAQHLSYRKIRWPMVIGSIILCVVCGYVGRNAYYGDVHEGSSVLWPDSRYNQDAKLINGPFTGLQNPMLVVLEGKGEAYAKKTLPPGADGEFHKQITEKAHMFLKGKQDLKRVICFPEVLKMAEAFQRKMASLPEVGATESFVDLLKKITMLLYLDDPNWNVLPGDYHAAAQNLHIIENTGRPGELDRYFTSDKQAMSIMIYVKDHKGDTIRNVIVKAKEFIEQINKEYTSEIKVNFRLAAGVIGTEGAVNEVLEEANLITFVLAAIGVWAVCAVIFRSAVAGLILLVPLIISNFVAIAYMAWRMIGLTVSTFPVFSVGIGLGVDYGCYIYARIQDEYKAGRDLESAIMAAIAGTGKTVAYIVLTVVLGVGFWYFSDLMFQANMGFMIGFIMVINAFGALLVLPAVVSIVKPKSITGLR